jgi:hypothetical protein
VKTPLTCLLLNFKQIGRQVPARVCPWASAFLSGGLNVSVGLSKSQGRRFAFRQLAGDGHFDAGSRQVAGGVIFRVRFVVATGASESAGACIRAGSCRAFGGFNVQKAESAAATAGIYLADLDSSFLRLVLHEFLQLPIAPVLAEKRLLGLAAISRQIPQLDTPAPWSRAKSTM